MAQSQPSDIGFGYISQNDGLRHPQGVPVEVPLTPASPLKSALKVPGTPGRRFDNPLSPTFREEQILEEKEDHTEKEQAKDLVDMVKVIIWSLFTNLVVENQNPSTDSKVCPPRCQFQLQSYCSFYAVRYLHDIQSDKGTTAAEQPSRLGCWNKNMASRSCSGNILRITGIVPPCILELLERWP